VVVDHADALLGDAERGRDVAEVLAVVDPVVDLADVVFGQPGVRVILAPAVVASSFLPE
jgi:hypothetical protein